MYTWDPVTSAYISSDTGTFVLNDAGAYVLGASVTTDLPDYAPGSTATFTAYNVTVGATIEFSVAHVDPGADGIVGTADDVLTYDLTGTTAPWFVVDGGAGDLDGVANGIVTTSWSVNWDAANQAFVLSATDLTNGVMATTNFTDAVHFDPVDAVAPDGTNGMIITTANALSTGTGQFPAFVQLQGQNNDVDDNPTTEQGYNPANPPVEDTGAAAPFNHPIQVKDIPTETIGETTYFVFRLDLNEPNDGSAGLATLDSLKLFYDTTGTAAPAADGSPTGANPLYDMGNISIVLADWSSGSGHGDYVFKIPVNVNLDPNDFIYLFSSFSNAEGGFEEWALGTSSFTPPPTPHASVSLTKDTVCPDDGHSIAGGTLLFGNAVEWTYAVTNTGTLGLNHVVVTDDNGTPDDGNPLNGDETLDDFTATAVTVTFNNNLYNIGDLNHNGIIDADDPTTGANEAETWQFTATGTAVAGAYTNIATVTTDAIFNPTNPPADSHPSGFDTSGYFGLNPHITLSKLTNGSDGPNLLQGQAITWTYDVTNDGNVDLTGVSVSDNPSQTISAVVITSGQYAGYNTGDLNHDGILNADDPTTAANEAETWHFIATGIAGSTAYSNTATATTDAILDDCGDSRTPSDTDDSSYTGHGQTLAGLTKGYWATHLTLWDVVTGDEKGAGAEINVVPKYDWDHDTKTGMNDLSTLTTSGPSSSLGLVKGAANGGGDSGLLMGDLNHDGLVGGDGTSDHLFFDLASAQILANSSVSGDARIILGSQAVAAQLNEYAAYAYDVTHGGVTAGFTASPQGLIEDAVRWLEGDTTFALSANGHSKVNYSTTNDLTSPSVQAIIDYGASNANTNDYTISGGAITFKSTAMSSSDASWSTLASTGFTYKSDYIAANTDANLLNDVITTVYADGEGLKNALAAYNHGLTNSTAGFVVSTDGTLIGWQDSLGGTVYDVHANTVNAFWGILEDQNLIGVHTIAGIADHA
jgi:uncharacterized repeat protein (TIGR01451 family)